MLKDRIANLGKYTSLDFKLSSFSPDRAEKSGEYSSFIVDRMRTTIFLVDEGTSDFATGWRENSNNREVLGVMKAQKDEFVLFLPGEPMIAKPEGNSSIRVWRTE